MRIPKFKDPWVEQQEAEAVREKGRHQWRLLRAGKLEQEEGLRLAREAYAEDKSAMYAMDLGVALLWLGKYAEAWEHFRSIITTDPRAGDNDYGMAGVAKWCLGEPRDAVSEWCAGLKAKYARAAGSGVRMPLLLFFASVVRPEIFDGKEARKLLQEKLMDPRIKSWPGPIAKLLLGQISEAEFQKQCQGRSAISARTRPWLAQFYRNVLGREQMTLSAFKDSMRQLADNDQPEWRGLNMVTELWCEEFFLARHEGAK